MEKAFENKEEVKGIIISKCKGGLIVDVESCLCFLTRFTSFSYDL